MFFSRFRKSVLKRLARLRYPDGHHLAYRDKAIWLLNHYNFVDRQLGTFGGFERAQMDYFFSIKAMPADAFLDIGANFGLYTVNAAVRGVAREIIAFEPDHRNAAQLAANLYLNNLTDRVVIRPEAVSDQAGTIGLFLQPSFSTGMSRIAQAGEDHLNVKSIKIDDEISWRGKTLLIKIDIEGHELAALNGMAELLRHNDCALQIEVFDNNKPAVDSYMAAVGYRCVHQIESDHYYLKE